MLHQLTAARSSFHSVLLEWLQYSIIRRDNELILAGFDLGYDPNDRWIKNNGNFVRQGINLITVRCSGILSTLVAEKVKVPQVFLRECSEMFYDQYKKEYRFIIEKQ